MKWFVIYYIFFSSIALAEKAEMDDFRKPNYLVDNKLRAGEYLMYDCKEEVYVCVDKDTFEGCLEDRQKAIDRQKPKYPCAPLKKFSNKRECLYKNYEMSHSLQIVKFCLPKKN